MSRWKQLDPDYQDHRADARCVDCDRHLGLGHKGDLCADCASADAIRDEDAYEPTDPKHPRWWRR